MMALQAHALLSFLVDKYACPVRGDWLTVPVVGQAVGVLFVHTRNNKAQGAQEDFLIFASFRSVSLLVLLHTTGLGRAHEQEMKSENRM
jgi:hypothetical protein